MRSFHRFCLAGVAAVTATVLAVPIAAAPANAAPAPTLPALPAPLNVPGASNAINQALQPGASSSLLGGGSGGGGALMGADGRTNIALPLVPQGGVRKQFTNAPTVEVSTKPGCAPFMLVAVPGTFEINRDDNPNKPVGLLKKLVDPLEAALGNRLSVTMINYDADAGVNGVGYNKSVDGGTKKTIATITDIASRCANASIILSGYSQGADVAGDAATAIGNRRTAVDPRRVAAVALFADPQRADNSNVISGTNQSRPDIPTVLQNAIGQAASDPSFAQLQMQLSNGVQSLLTQTGLAGGNSAVGSTGAAGVAGSTSTPNAGQAGAGQPSSTAPQSDSSSSPDSSLAPDAPTSTDQAPTSDAPGAGDAATPSAGMAGAASHGQMQVHLADYSVPAGRGPLSSDGDGLRPYKSVWPKDFSTQQAGTNSTPGPGTEPLTIVSPAGEVKAVSDLTNDERSKYAAAGWFWNRSDQQKDQRRKVIQDLYLLNSPECSGQTLRDCQDKYVDARSGQTHTELLVSSSQLVAARDKAAAAADKEQVPAGAYDQINHCLTLQADSCRDYFATQIGAPAAPAPASSVSYGGLVASGGTSYGNLDAKTKEALSRAQYFTDSGSNTPIVQLALRNQGRSLSSNDSRTTSAAACQNADAADQLGWDYQLPDGSGKDWKYATSGDSSNDWLTHVWWRATYGEKGKRLIDLSDNDLLKYAKSPDCAAWIGLTAKAFLDRFNKHQIVYNDDKYVAPNETAAAAANPVARKDLARNLYLYGGCGPFDASDAITKDAPNGPWTLGACVNEVTGRTSSLGKRSDQQLGQLVLKAKSTYQQSRPDWTNAVLTRGDIGFAENNAAPAAGGALSPARRATSDFGCDQIPVRLCAVFKTSIDGPKDAPPGVTTMVLPHYPEGGSGQLDAPDGPSERANDVPAGQVGQKYDAGWRWLTPEVAAAVSKLDAASEQLTTITPADQNAAPGVTTLIKKSTPASEAGTSRDGEAGAPIGSVRKIDDVPGKNPNPYLYHGWVFGRTSADDQHRPALLYNLYALGGCGARHELTWKDCYGRYSEPNSEHPYPEYATTNDELETKITSLRKNQANLEWDANLKGRTDLMKDCADKPVWNGKDGDGSCATKNTDSQTQDAGEHTDTPTTQSPTTTPEQSPNEPQETTADTPTPNSDNAASTGDGSDNTTSDGTATTDPQITRVDMSAGADSTTAEQSAGQATSSSNTSSLAGGSGADSSDDGGLAQGVSNLITGAGDSAQTTSATAAGTATAPSNIPSGGPVNVSPITQRAVAGGGLAGPRDSDFGELKGRVVEFCVPGDLVCSLPANSQLARDLTQFAKNVSFDFPDMLSDEGATKMGGLIALQALNNVADVTGLPRTKLSADTLQALVNLAAGGAMLAAQQPQGAALVADGVSKLPNAMPEFFAQLRDVPALLRGLPTAGETAMKNTGLDKIVARVNAAFQQAGMTSPLDVQKYPEAISALMQGLLKDNTGLMKVVTDPKYWQANAHGLYPELKVSGGVNSVAWAQQWIDQLAKLAGLSR